MDSGIRIVSLSGSRPCSAWKGCCSYRPPHRVASNAVGASVALVKSSVTLTQTSEGGLTCVHRATHRFSFSLEDEAFQSSSSLVKGKAEAALYCAHRTSTVSPCAFCEQEGHLPLPPHPSEDARSRNIRRSAASSFPPASYPNPLSCFKGSLVDPRLRASNEGSPRPRVARAQEIIRLHPLLCSASRRTVRLLSNAPIFARE